MEALPFTFIPVHKVSVQVHLFRIKRKRAFFINPFSLGLTGQIYKRIELSKKKVDKWIKWMKIFGNTIKKNHE